MRFFGEDRDTLIQKKVKLVQSGHFRGIEGILDKKDINGLDDIVAFDYMGSYEFECGTLPRSLRRMTINKDFYQVFVFNQYKDENGNSLKVYAPYVTFKNVRKIVNQLAVDGYSGLQEYCYLNRHIKKEDNEENTYYKDSSNFWWDIENDFFIFFENTDKVLQAMDSLRKRKFGYEDERNKAKSVLKRVYMKNLTASNTPSYLNWVTSIKDYHFDKDAKVHFIEFNENATLEDIFMEAIIISKFDKGTVVFNINEIPFTITEDTLLDNIVNENGINLVDSCTYSKKIDELISQYNEEINKKQKQTKLVNVLRLIRDKKLENEKTI